MAQEEGYSSLTKIFHLAAYKRAWRALRLKCEPHSETFRSQRGVRILSKRKRGMLLGARFVENVPLWYKFKPTSPRDADTAKTLCLEVCSVPAVCELPVSLCEREFVPSDWGKKLRTPTRSVLIFWRRKRDSNPRAFWANGFQDRLVVTASIFLHILQPIGLRLYAENIYTALKNSFFRIRFAYPAKSSGSLLTSDECGYSRLWRDILLQPFWIVNYY